MVRRHIIPIALFVFAVLLWWTYESTRPIPGVEGKGDVSDWIPWVSLAGSITSLLTGMVTLSLKLIDIRSNKVRQKKRG